MSRRAFKPTAEQRRCVETMTGNNVPEAEICRQIKNPETDQPIDLETLHKHFAAEIAFGAAKMKLLACELIYATIFGYEGGIADDEARVRLLLFFLRTRAGWNRRASRQEKVGDPIDTQRVQREVSHELDRLARRLKAEESGVLNGVLTDQEKLHRPHGSELTSRPLPPLSRNGQAAPPAAQTVPHPRLYRMVRRAEKTQINHRSGAAYPESIISIGCGEICRASKPGASGSENVVLPHQLDLIPGERRARQSFRNISKGMPQAERKRHQKRSRAALAAMVLNNS
jgi:hypothetical protein